MLRLRVNAVHGIKAFRHPRKAKFKTMTDVWTVKNTAPAFLVHARGLLSRFRQIENHVVASFVLVLSLATITLIAVLADRGFDFTDEGFYYNVISKPFLYKTSLTQFGHIYHPIFEYLNGDIAAFRRFNIVAVCAVALAFAYMLVIRWCPSLNRRPFLALAVCSGLAVSAFVQIHWLPLSPSYNWQNLAGALCFLIGALGIASDGSRRDTLLWASILGIGIWLAAMAKPPTGVALAVATLPFAFLVSARPLSAIFTAGSVAAGLTLLVAYAIDGSVGGFVQRIQAGREAAAALWTGYSSSGIWIRIDPVVMSTFEQKIFWVAFAFSGAAAWLALRESAWAVALRTVLVAAAAVGALLFIAGVEPFQIHQSLMQGLWLAAVPGAMVAVVLACRWREVTLRLSMVPLACFLLLVLVPLTYAVGTGNNYWFQSGHLMIAWIGAAAIVIYRVLPPWQSERLLVMMSLGTIIMTGILVSIGIDYPYRSFVSLRHQANAAEIGERRSVLKLTAESADYLAKLREAAFRNGFLPDTPVLDLTGRHPGSVFALGGTAPGLAWILSGFSGSVEMVRLALGSVSCDELARAWLLVPSPSEQKPAPATPWFGLKMGSSTPLPTGALIPLGIDHERGYRELIVIASPVGYGSQALLAPTAPNETKDRCEMARNKSSDAMTAPGPVGGRYLWRLE
jgi:hypothetical protein